LGADVAVADILDAGRRRSRAERGLGKRSCSIPLLPAAIYAHAHQVGTALAHGFGVRNAQGRRSVLDRARSIPGAPASLPRSTRSEALLDGAAPAIAFMRCGYFVETWSEVAGAAMTGGRAAELLDPGPEDSNVSTIDVGRTAARRLLARNGPESGSWR
jgi:hypothetical protein